MLSRVVATMTADITHACHATTRHEFSEPDAVNLQRRAGLATSVLLVVWATAGCATAQECPCCQAYEAWKAHATTRVGSR